MMPSWLLCRDRPKGLWRPNVWPAALGPGCPDTPGKASLVHEQITPDNPRDSSANLVEPCPRHRREFTFCEPFSQTRATPQNSLRFWQPSWQPRARTEGVLGERPPDKSEVRRTCADLHRRPQAAWHARGSGVRFSSPPPESPAQRWCGGSGESLVKDLGTFWGTLVF